MDEKSKTIIYVMKEIFKLPLDKKTNTIKMDDVIKLIEKFSKEIPEEDVEEYWKTVTKGVREINEKLDKVLINETDCVGCEKVKEYCEKKGDPNLYNDWQNYKKRISKVGIEKANEELGFNKDGSEKSL